MAGGLGADGKIYGMPYDATDVLVIDVTQRSVSTVPINAADTKTTISRSRWSGAAFSADHRIFGIPMDEAAVLVVQPNCTAAGCDNGTKLTAEQPVVHVATKTVTLQAQPSIRTHICTHHMCVHMHTRKCTHAHMHRQ